MKTPIVVGVFAIGAAVFSGICLVDRPRGTSDSTFKQPVVLPNGLERIGLGSDDPTKRRYAWSILGLSFSSGSYSAETTFYMGEIELTPQLLHETRESFKGIDDKDIEQLLLWGLSETDQRVLTPVLAVIAQMSRDEHRDDVRNRVENFVLPVVRQLVAEADLEADARYAAKVALAQWSATSKPTN
jgi:hypothetical protein